MHKQRDWQLPPFALAFLWNSSKNVYPDTQSRDTVGRGDDKSYPSYSSKDIPYINWKKKKTKNQYEELGIPQNIFVINPCDLWSIVN